MTTPIENVLIRLEGVTKNGTGWMAKCPAHEDRTPSLSISVGDEDRVLLTCMAGCSTEAVVDALGLEMSDLFVPMPKKEPARIVATYDYVDEDGALLSQAVRYAPKTFKQRVPNGNGGWSWKLGNTRRVPYRLPQLVAGVEAGRWVLIVEGEKDAENLEKLRFIATCNAAGAGKWRRDFRVHFAGAKVAIIPDNDRSGNDHAQDVAKSLDGIAETVRVVTLPGLPEKGDVSDWIAAGGTVKALNQLIESARAWAPTSSSGAPAPSAKVAGPPEPGDLLLDELEKFILRFCAFPNQHYAVAIALWIAHTHAIECFEITPRLAIVSATKESGKSTVLEVIDLTAARSRYVGSMSVAYLFRAIDAHRPTLLLDEIDAVFGVKAKGDEDLRALINQGFRCTATVGRCVGDGAKQTATDFSAFAPVAMAGIGSDCIPDTLKSRSVMLRMRKRAPDEHVEGVRYRLHRPIGEALRDRLERWAAAQFDRLKTEFPVMPDGIADRPANTWEALLSMADVAGGDWPERARKACVALNKARQEEDDNVGVALLTDLRTVFGDAPKLHSAALCSLLNALEDAGWSGWHDGRGIQTRDLARRLKEFGVASKQLRIGDESKKGFERAAFEDAWTRYLNGADDNRADSEARSGTETIETCETPLTSTVSMVSDVSIQGPTGKDLAAHRAEEAQARIAARLQDKS